ncbi:MAG: radical SAM protein [Theionarchaea archaeon]|nr:radical SAM protein [Theionarchaea archaeon]
MNILLVVPPLDAPRKPLVFDPVPTQAPFPPLGILYISAALSEQGHSVSVFDGTFQKDLKSFCKGRDFDLAGVYSTLLHYSALLETCRTLKEQSLPVVIGGPLPSCYPQLITCDDVDFLVAGEGERAITVLAECLEASDDCTVPADSAIPNLVWKEHGVHHGPPTIIEDVDSIPFPDRDNFIFEKYMAVWKEYFQFTCTSLLSSRGCPHKCNFCDKSVFGTLYRARSVENIMPEISYLEGRGIDKLWFADDLFTLDRKRVLDLCAELRKEHPDLEWYCESRVDTIDGDMLEAMRKAGCTWIGFGVESGNPDILRYIGKGHDLEAVKKAFRMTRKAGIKRCAYFILGFPRDTPETVEDTIRFAMSIDPDSVEFSLPIPIPGTRLSHEVETVTEGFDTFDNRMSLVFEHPHFSSAEAEAMIERAYIRFTDFKKESDPDFALEDQW